MSDSAFNDNDPSVYKTHILYMLPTDENCNKLLRVLEDHPINEHVFQQDVSKLSARPPWLDGVPILVDKSTSKAHKGRNIYAYIQEWKSDDFLPAGACTGGYASFESNGEDELGDASTKKFASLSTSGVFDLEEEGGGGGGGRQQQQQPAATASGGGGGGGGGARNQRKEQLMNEAQSKAQALMDARNMQDQRLKARVPAGGAKSPYQTQQPPQQQQQQPQYYQPQPPQQQQPQYYQPPQQQQQQYYRPPQPPQQQQQYYQPLPQQQPRPPPYQQQQPSQYYYQPPSQQQQQQQQYQSSYF